MKLADYARILERSQFEPPANLESPPKARRLGFLGPDIREALQVFATGCIRPLASRKARRLFQQRPLRLHLGCGITRLRGWVNIDLIGLGADLAWDLRHPLPLADGSADAAFHEH